MRGRVVPKGGTEYYVAFDIYYMIIWVFLKKRCVMH